MSMRQQCKREWIPKRSAVDFVSRKLRNWEERQNPVSLLSLGLTIFSIWLATLRILPFSVRPCVRTPFLDKTGSRQNLLCPLSRPWSIASHCHHLDNIFKLNFQFSAPFSNFISSGSLKTACDVWPCVFFIFLLTTAPLPFSRAFDRSLVSFSPSKSLSKHASHISNSIFEPIINFVTLPRPKRRSILFSSPFQPHLHNPSLISRPGPLSTTTMLLLFAQALEPSFSPSHNERTRSRRPKPRVEEFSAGLARSSFSLPPPLRTASNISKALLNYNKCDSYLFHQLTFHQMFFQLEFHHFYSPALLQVVDSTPDHIV